MGEALQGVWRDWPYIQDLGNGDVSRHRKKFVEDVVGHTRQRLQEGTEELG